MTVAPRPAIKHDDLAAQRAIVEEIRALPFTGARAILPRIRRPRQARPAPLPLLFASLPEQRRPPRPWEQPLATEAALSPTPWALTPEELAEVEALVIGRYKGDADTRTSCMRWDAWIADGRSPTSEILQLPGVIASGHIDVLETRLGWAAKVSYATTKKCLAHGRPIRPDFDEEGLFFWETREAAVQYAAYRAWSSVQDYQERPDRVRRAWARFASEMQEFLARCGIDATRPPAPGLKRIVMPRERERELGRLAEAEKAAAKAAARVEPDDGVPGETRLGRHLIRIGAIEPPSPLALKRRRLKEERAAAARAAPIEDEEPVPAPAVEPAPGLALTMDMGRLSKAHWSDRTDPADRFEVACPPFHLHDKDAVDPVDEFLGQVVGIEPARTLLFQRRVTGGIFGREVGTRYVLLRFWDDKQGQVWHQAVEGEDDRAVHQAIETTVARYWGSKAA